jgi:hypothetical protein
MYRKVLVIAVSFVLLLTVTACGSTNTPSVVTFKDNFTTLLFHSNAHEAWLFVDNSGEFVEPKPGEHFVVISADILAADLNDFTYQKPTAISAKSFLWFDYGTIFSLPDGINLVKPPVYEEIKIVPQIGWFYRLPEGVWPHRLVFADGTIVEITSDK